jgi:CheY-like chemotaxis protein
MPSILVVDDEDQIRQLIRETLEQAGYHSRKRVMAERLSSSIG